jgi:mitochondrial fission protein ELM1
MISEAAVTGKPVYIAMMKSIKNNYRFKKFYYKLQELGITRELKDNIDTLEL